MLAYRNFISVLLVCFKANSSQLHILDFYINQLQTVYKPRLLYKPTAQLQILDFYIYNTRITTSRIRKPKILSRNIEKQIVFELI